MRIIFFLVTILGLLVIGMITLFEPEKELFLLLVAVPQGFVAAEFVIA